jgi:hypothetical protein
MNERVREWCKQKEELENALKYKWEFRSNLNMPSLKLKMNSMLK